MISIEQCRRKGDIPGNSTVRIGTETLPSKHTMRQLRRVKHTHSQGYDTSIVWTSHQHPKHQLSNTCQRRRCIPTTSREVAFNLYLYQPVLSKQVRLSTSFERPRPQKADEFAAYGLTRLALSQTSKPPRCRKISSTRYIHTHRL